MTSFLGTWKERAQRCELTLAGRGCNCGLSPASSGGGAWLGLFESPGLPLVPRRLCLSLEDKATRPEQFVSSSPVIELSSKGGDPELPGLNKFAMGGHANGFMNVFKIFFYPGGIHNSSTGKFYTRRS